MEEEATRREKQGSVIGDAATATVTEQSVKESWRDVVRELLLVGDREDLNSLRLTPILQLSGDSESTSDVTQFLRSELPERGAEVLRLLVSCLPSTPRPEWLLQLLSDNTFLLQSLVIVEEDSNDWLPRADAIIWLTHSLPHCLPVSTEIRSRLISVSQRILASAPTDVVVHVERLAAVLYAVWPLAMASVLTQRRSPRLVVHPLLLRFAASTEQVDDWRSRETQETTGIDPDVLLATALDYLIVEEDNTGPAPEKRRAQSSNHENNMAAQLEWALLSARSSAAVARTCQATWRRSRVHPSSVPVRRPATPPRQAIDPDTVGRLKTLLEQNEKLSAEKDQLAATLSELRRAKATRHTPLPSPGSKPSPVISDTLSSTAPLQESTIQNSLNSLPGSTTEDCAASRCRTLSEVATQTSAAQEVEVVPEKPTSAHLSPPARLARYRADISELRRHADKLTEENSDLRKLLQDEREKTAQRARQLKDERYPNARRQVNLLLSAQLRR